MLRKVLITALVLLGVLLPEAGLFASNWSGTFRWNAGESLLNLSNKANASTFGAIDELASSIEAGRIVRINVTSYSSPEGSVAWNTKLAARRSAAVVALLKQRLPELSDSQIVVKDVPEDWARTKAYIRASKKEWRDEALTLLENAKTDREALLKDLWGGIVWDELMWNCFSRIRRTEIRVEYTKDIEFSATSEKPVEIPVGPVGAQICVKFPGGRSDLLPQFLDNAEQLQALQSFVTSLPEGSTIVLDALSSPEGKLSWNMTLARRRAESVKRKLVELGVSADRITVRSCEENWAGLRDVVSSSESGFNKDEVLRILDDASLSGATKKARLEALDGGVTWNRLIVASMRTLRGVRVSAAAE